MKIFITGRPGIGKTTVFMKVVEMLRREGSKVLGFYCPEAREGGVRIGFRIVDIETGESGWLALARDRFEGTCVGRIGRYCVIREDAERIALKILERFYSSAVLAVDEIGPMELMIDSLRNLIDRFLSSEKPGVYVVHERIVGELMRRYHDAQIYRITEANRSEASLDIFSRIIRYISRER
ncbi:MAG: NTPase [Sulfolobales archaeon]